jgi:inosine-uridine nucleoside N-ribohydrolase
MLGRIDPPANPRRIVFDSDLGIDDALALALAWRSPELNPVALVTSYGATTLTHATRNARVVLSLAGGPDVPVFPGAAHPLDRPYTPGRDRHGPSGVGYAAVPPAPATTPAGDALLKALDTQSTPVTVVALGPLTNLASALARAPAAVIDGVTEVVAMCGSGGRRVSAERWADFNAWCDPDALDAVAGSPVPLRLVGLDVTERVRLSTEAIAALAAGGDLIQPWLGEALRWYAEASRRAGDASTGCPVHDAVVVGAVIAPDLLQWTPRRFRVALDEDERRGHTSEAADGHAVAVAAGIDVAAMRRILSRIVPEP